MALVLAQQRRAWPSNCAADVDVMHEQLRRVASVGSLLGREEALLTGRALEELVPVRARWRLRGHAQNASGAL
jgi:hypothetical protein